MWGDQPEIGAKKALAIGIPALLALVGSVAAMYAFPHLENPADRALVVIALLSLVAIGAVATLVMTENVLGVLLAIPIPLMIVVVWLTSPS